jgi:hypothetical protein
MQVEELDSNDLVNMCVQGDRESLQEYMHRVVKLTARAPGVSESSIIDAIVGGLRVGNCQDVLDRVKQKPLQELFEVMQEYCKSDKGRRRRLDRANAAKKQKQQGSGTNRRGGKITRRSKQTVRSTTYRHPLTRTRTGAVVGTRADTRVAEGRSRSSKTRLSEAAVSGFSVGSMGSTPNITHTSALRRPR